MLIEPRLEQHRGRDPVHEFASAPSRNAPLAQSTRRFDRREALVDELDVFSRAVGERLSEATRTGRLASLVAAAIERESDEKPLDAFLRSETNELGDQPPWIAPRERRARMRYQTELVGHGHPHPHLPEIDGCHSHPAASTL
jgi:hypothetical protein